MKEASQLVNIPASAEHPFQTQLLDVPNHVGSQRPQAIVVVHIEEDVHRHESREMYIRNAPVSQERVQKSAQQIA